LEFNVPFQHKYGYIRDDKLATVSIAELLQNRQHAQTPYLDQICHATVDQWSMLTGLISSGSVYCVTHAGKMPKCSQFLPNFHIWGSCVHPPLPTRGLRLHAKFHFNPFMVSPSRNTKTQFWANFDILRLLYPAIDKGQI